MRLFELSVVIIEVMKGSPRDLVYSCIDGLIDNRTGEQMMETPEMFAYKHHKFHLSMESKPIPSAPNQQQRRRVLISQEFLDHESREIFAFDAAMRYISQSNAPVEAIGINPHFLLLEGGAREWLTQQCVSSSAFASCGETMLPIEVKLFMEKWDSKVEISMQSVEVSSDTFNKEDVLLVKTNMHHDINNNEEAQKLLSVGKQKLEDADRFFSELVGE